MAPRIECSPLDFERRVELLSEIAAFGMTESNPFKISYSVFSDGRNRKHFY
jgi:hypothetical protein